MSGAGKLGPGKKMQDLVLSVLRQQKAPLSAYNILAQLRDTNERLAPPTVYRALASLEAEGKIHKLESRNAYVACQHEEHANASIMSICGTCDTVEEFVADDVLGHISNLAENAGFKASSYVIEIRGLCKACAG